MKNSSSLQQKLINVTVGKSGLVDKKEAENAIGEYFNKAFSAADIKNLEYISSAVSLNSISFLVEFEFERKTTKAFGKVHIESNTKSVSPLGAEEEYLNAELLEKNGWPVLKPILKSENNNYPLLLYPKVENKTLFQKLENSFKEKRNLVTQKDLTNLDNMNKIIWQAEERSIENLSAEEANNSPVQTLFLRRVEKGARIDQWYKGNAKIENLKTTFGEIKNKEWIINGVRYKTTLEEILNKIREIFKFQNEAPSAIMHGDDHAGNIFLKNEQAIVFDPAFAGRNPLVLGNIKSLAHNSYLQIAGMYYETGITSEYKISENYIETNWDFENSYMFETLERIAKSNITQKILPGLKYIGETEKSIRFLKATLASCALLTINPMEIKRPNNLFEMAILFYNLGGFESLNIIEN